MERSEYLSETKDSPSIGLTTSSPLIYITSGDPTGSHREAFPSRAKEGGPL